MAHDPSAFIQEHFRIRLADSEGLNASFDGGDPAEDTNATIATGTDFRIRFKGRETAGGSDNATFKAQCNREAAGWVDVSVNQGPIATPVMAVPSVMYNDGDATNVELLTSTTADIDGEGFHDNTMNSNISPTNEEFELEFCLRINGFYNGPGQNIAGDEIEFRIVESDGTVFAGTYTNPTITVAETAGYIGGTFCESPNRCGPWADSNGNLYAIIGDSEVAENLMMLKSADGGDTWREQDGGNRPSADDLEGLDSVISPEESDSIHLAQIAANDNAYYHKFRMSDHGTDPDTWEITDELVTTIANQTGEQACALEVRSDTTVVLFYSWDDLTNDRLAYKIRSSGGSWGGENDLDSTGSTGYRGVACVRGESDKIHIFYKDHTNDDIYHKSLTLSGDSLGAREDIADRVIDGGQYQWAFGWPVYWDDAGTEMIMVIFQGGDLALYSAVVQDDASPDASKLASDNDADRDLLVGRCIAGHMSVDPATDTAYMFYSHSDDQDIFRTEAVNDGGWSTDVEEQPDVAMHQMSSSIFTHSSGNGGAKVFGYIWDTRG